MSIEVITPGLQTTIQDEGRSGWRHMGVPQSGAADLFSCKAANYLLGKACDSAVIECTLTGPRLSFLKEMQILITGSDMNPKINDKQLDMYKPYSVNVGDELVMSACSYGCRSYIAFSDDLVCNPIMGSQSTYLPANFGGFNGKILQKGDIIQTISSPNLTSKLQDSAEITGQDFTNQWCLKAIPGPEFEVLDQSSQTLLFSETFKVSNDSDRMGSRLICKNLNVKTTDHMTSGPLFPGTLQCPKDGSPILLGSDAQTLGGYPRLIQVPLFNQHLIGQLRPGDSIEFRRISNEEAVEELKQQALSFPFIANI
jgi:biotin-dependent carboxylase-like uncharacterized protein